MGFDSRWTGEKIVEAAGIELGALDFVQRGKFLLSKELTLQSRNHGISMQPNRSNFTDRESVAKGGIKV